MSSGARATAHLSHGTPTSRKFSALRWRERAWRISGGCRVGRAVVTSWPAPSAAVFGGTAVKIAPSGPLARPVGVRVASTNPARKVDSITAITSERTELAGATA
jgi:hypothetical protein